MSVTRLREIRTFFAGKDGELDVVVDLTFHNMFVIDPASVAMFPADMAQHRRVFSGILRKIIELTRTSHLWPVSVQTGTAILPGLESIKARHDTIGVGRPHFQVMKMALLQALESRFPDEFTPELRDALSYIFDVLARSLTEASSELDNSDPLLKFSQRRHDSEISLSDILGDTVDR